MSTPNQKHMVICALMGLMLISACSEVRFNPGESNEFFRVDPPAPPTPEPPLVDVRDQLTQKAQAKAADLLIVVDNSDSMYMDHLNGRMAQQFRGIGSLIEGLDLHIGVTTTDTRYLQVAGWGGSLDRMNNQNYLRADQVAESENLLLSKIHREETLGCRHSRGPLPCGSNNEQALGAAARAIHHRTGANQGFFRDEAELILLFISDENEGMDEQSHQLISAELLLDLVQAELGTQKQVRALGLIIQPDDHTCLRQQRRQELFGQAAEFGTQIQRLADLTGGWTMSLCERNALVGLSPLFDRLKAPVATETSYLLSKPVANQEALQVTVTPAQDFSWELFENRRLVFHQPPLPGSQIEVLYQTESEAQLQ